MFTIKVNSDVSKADSNQSLDLVDEFSVKEDANELASFMVNVTALNLLKKRLATYNSVKTMGEVKKLNFQATPNDSESLVIFEGNIRDSLFFLIEFRTISQKAYDEAISKLDSASYKYKLPVKKNDTASSTAKSDNIEEKKQQSYLDSSSCLFSHAKNGSTITASTFYPASCSL